MATCQLCKHEFRSLRYNTEDISICVRCVNTLNESPEPASAAIGRLAEMLARGMRRNIERSLNSDDAFVQERARRRLADFEREHVAALPRWINNLLKNSANSTRDFKIVRAYRRGLLRMEPSRQWSYPSDWADRASRVRRRDRACQTCGVANVSLDAHHIVYLSNYGTNQQNNLVALCRPCHEEVHDRSFDLGEADEPGRSISIGVDHDVWPLAPAPGTVPVPPLTLSRNLICPGCWARVTAKIPATELRTQQVRCPGCKLVFIAADHPAIEPMLQPIMPSPIAAPPHTPQPEYMRNTTVRRNSRKIWTASPLRVARLVIGLMMVFLVLSLFALLRGIGP